MQEEITHFEYPIHFPPLSFATKRAVFERNYVRCLLKLISLHSLEIWINLFKMWIPYLVCSKDEKFNGVVVAFSYEVS